jgi:hypothetical protein
LVNFLFHNAIDLKVDIGDYVKRRGIYTNIKQVKDIFAIADRLASFLRIIALRCEKVIWKQKLYITSFLLEIGIQSSPNGTTSRTEATGQHWKSLQFDGFW